MKKFFAHNSAHHFYPFPYCYLLRKAKKTSKCGPNVICTEIFAIINTYVKDINGNAVDLDEVYTVRKSNNEVLKYDQEGEAGVFQVLDDSYQKELQNQTDSFQFIGKKNGQIIVDEPFVISADCCHVNLVQGRQEIIIQ